jgi:beta-lactamase regulating signal transducer with metallopeptidase domain
MIALVLNHLWQSSLCVSGAGLLALALHRNGANVRFWLWFAASIKFLVPFFAVTALSSYLLAPMVPSITAPKITLVEPLAKPFSTPAEVQTATKITAPPSTHLAPSEPHAGPVRPALPVTSPAHFGLESTLLAIWAAGFLILSIRWLIRWSRVRALLREAVEMKADVPIVVKSSASLLEPGLVGIVRPIILLPQGVAGQLSQAELRAVLAHELCHWRRHDNLLATSHMLVEALFWFFPLVWWLGTRLNAERERACDEAVLAAGTDPHIYAEGILKVCRAYLRSPLACVAGVSGAGLTKRIEAIAENRLVLRLNAGRKFVVGASAAILIALPLAFGLIAAPVMQKQAKAAQVVAAGGKQSPPPTSEVSNAVSLKSSMATNAPARETAAPSQTEVASNSRLEKLVVPQTDLSELVPTKALKTPALVASNELPAATVGADDQHVPQQSASQVIANGSFQEASNDSDGAPVKADSNEHVKAICNVVYNNSVTGRVISPKEIELPSFVCGRRGGQSIYYNYGSCTNNGTVSNPGYSYFSQHCPTRPLLRMNIELEDSTDATKMRPGEVVTLGGIFKVITRNNEDYLFVQNAKFLHADPLCTFDATKQSVGCNGIIMRR